MIVFIGEDLMVMFMVSIDVDVLNYIRCVLFNVVIFCSFVDCVIICLVNWLRKFGMFCVKMVDVIRFVNLKFSGNTMIFFNVVL